MFTEFMEMVERRFSPELADAVLQSPGLVTGGVYTSVGTYPSTEWRGLVEAVSAATGVPVADLLRSFGFELVGRFAALYPAVMPSTDDALEFLAQVEEVIHLEVRKLYPEAELPSFDVRRETGTLVMEYSSPRALGDLAHGLAEGVLDHFGERATITRRDVPGDPTRVRLTIVREGA